MSDQISSNAKVLFRVMNDDSTSDVETLWATKLGEDTYQLDNIPFYAYGVSWKDIVFAPLDQNEGFPTFQCVSSKSGHRTVRIAFDLPVENGNVSDQLLQGLVWRGCTYEGANRRLMSIDIPPEINLQTIRQYLIDKDATWEHADPTYEELFP